MGVISMASAEGRDVLMWDVPDGDWMGKQRQRGKKDEGNE